MNVIVSEEDEYYGTDTLQSATMHSQGYGLNWDEIEYKKNRRKTSKNMRPELLKKLGIQEKKNLTRILKAEALMGDK